MNAPNLAANDTLEELLTDLDRERVVGILVDNIYLENSLTDVIN
jgi:hypothetical protein